MEINKHICPNCFFHNNEDVIKCLKCDYKINSESKTSFALSPGTVLAERYIIGRILGSGGFGITYKAKDLLTDELCAIKEYFPMKWAFRKRDETEVLPISEAKESLFIHGRKGFIEEAKILMKFRSDKNIVHVKNFFALNNTAYLIMEFLDGTNFKTLINKQNGKVPFNVGVEVFLTAANALDRVHSYDILHRDISPENIFITSDAGIKLIDFGSARQAVDNNMSVLLKPGFAPVEQYSSNGKQGAWTDIYSLAATFYLSVSGKSVPDAQSRVVEDTLERLENVCSEATVEWGNVIEKALEIDASERYQNISEMLGDIGKVLTREQPINGSIPNVIPYVYIEQCKYEGAWSQCRKIYIEKDRKYTFGRSYQTCDFVVDMADYLSRSHCDIVYSEKSNCFLVKDLSSNGTYFSNGVRMPRDKYVKVNAESKINLGSGSTVLRVGVENED